MLPPRPRAALAILAVLAAASRTAALSLLRSPSIRHDARMTFGRSAATTRSLTLPNTSDKSSAHTLHLSSVPSYDGKQADPLISRTSQTLKACSWVSWWSQLVLTVISAITFLFARNVMDAQAAAYQTTTSRAAVASKFFLPGLGLVASAMSIVWTWGQRRLARRFIRRADTSRIQAANLLRRVIRVGVTLNLAGLLLSVLGSQYIVGTLVAKSMSGFVGLGGGGGVVSQTLQPLDVLVVQANVNVLSSHFVSIACLLWLSRMVDLLDPPSLEDDK